VLGQTDRDVNHFFLEAMSELLDENISVDFDARIEPENR